MDYKYTATFESQLIACKINESPLISKASLQNLAPLLPSDIDYESNVDLFDAEVYNPSNKSNTYTLKLSSNDNPNPIDVLGLKFIGDSRTKKINVPAFSSNTTTVHMDLAGRAGVYNLKVSLYDDDGTEVANKQIKISIFAESLKEFVTRSIIILMVSAGIVFFVMK